MVNTNTRREKIIESLKDSNEPIKASLLAKEHNVSRQIIVGDIAILRAQGYEILPTPHGYILEQSVFEQHNTAVIACKHSIDNTLDELYAIVDNGGTIVDVVIEHPVYGELRGLLNVESRYDADVFYNKLKVNNVRTLSSITGGIHIHTIKYRDEDCLLRIKNALSDAGILLEEN